MYDAFTLILLLLLVMPLCLRALVLIATIGRPDHWTQTYPPDSDQEVLARKQAARRNSVRKVRWSGALVLGGSAMAVIGFAQVSRHPENLLAGTLTVLGLINVGVGYWKGPRLLVANVSRTPQESVRTVDSVEALRTVIANVPTDRPVSYSIWQNGIGGAHASCSSVNESILLTFQPHQHASAPADRFDALCHKWNARRILRTDPSELFKTPEFELPDAVSAAGLLADYFVVICGADESATFELIDDSGDVDPTLYANTPAAKQ